MSDDRMKTNSRAVDIVVIILFGILQITKFTIAAFITSSGAVMAALYVLRLSPSAEQSESTFTIPQITNGAFNLHLAFFCIAITYLIGVSVLTGRIPRSYLPYALERGVETAIERLEQQLNKWIGRSGKRPPC